MANYAHPMVASKVARPPRQRRGFWWRLFVWLAVGLVIVISAYFLLIYPWISRWGATEQELRATLPGDDLVTNSLTVTTKAVTIQARPEEVWPWLVQLGVGRGGMYSYLWVENWLMRLNVENSDEIRPEWQNLKVGDFIRFTPKEYRLNPGPGLWVISIEPERALVGCFGLENTPPDCNQSSTWQFVLQPEGDHTTRLILRSHGAGEPGIGATAVAKFAHAFVFYMERKMLIGIKERAEMLTEQ